MAMGTVGFLYKTGPVDRIIEAVRMIACGSFVCETDLIRRILTRLARWADEPEEARAENLSEREMEVLALVALGRSNKEISRELFVAEGTIKAHISHIMAKLRVERRTDLARHALTSGFVRLNDEAP
jgi:DNA-binding NarL/FixJ family response regulator